MTEIQRQTLQFILHCLPLLFICTLQLNAVGKNNAVLHTKLCHKCVTL